MNIWLITVGEPLPTDGAPNRLLRTGILANFLINRGHKVLWWSSTFNHVLKKQRFNKDTLININDNFSIWHLHSIGYKKNISFRRIVNHYQIVRKFNRLARREPQPDIILCSLPTLELSAAAISFGKRHGIPVVLDIRDLWPDIFLNLIPVRFRSLMALLLSPMFGTARAACSGAAAIVGITPAFVDWGVKYANRSRSTLDRDFPLGYPEVLPSQEEVAKAEKFWNSYGVNKNKNRFVACFFGTMGRQFEIEIVIQAARRLEEQERDFLFILCGSGDNMAYYKNLALECDNVVFPGWVGAAEIWTLMRYSSVGLAPYRSSPDFMASIPNKSIEYLSAGLPVVSSLKGVLKDLLLAYNCGLTYENGDAEDLASILIDLYDSRDRLKAMSENAYSLYKEKFVAEKVYESMIGYLEYVCRIYNKSGEM